MATRIAFTRLAPSLLPRATIASVQSRYLSVQGVAAIEKLRNLLEEYRKQNYAQEMPTRFKKEVLSAAQEGGIVDKKGMQRVIHNIHMDGKISARDLDLIFHELGGEKARIPVDDMMKII